MCQEQKPFKVSAFLEMHVSAFLEVWSVILFFILSLCLSYFTIGIYSCLAMFGLKKTKAKRKQTFHASKLRFLCFCLFGFPQACLRISLSIRVTPTPSNWSVIGLMRGWLKVGGAF